MKLTLLVPMILPFLTIACAPSDTEERVRAFVSHHQSIVEPKLRAMNLASWNASATGEKRYYDEQAALEMDVRRIYANREEFTQLSRWKASGAVNDTLLRRQLTVLYHTYLASQMDTSLMQRIVDQSAAIAERFNTFRPLLNGREVSDNEIDVVLRTERDPAKRRAAWEASKEVGAAVAPMIIELVKLRNKAARGLGFPDFYVMSLTVAEQDERDLMALFDELQSLTDEPYRMVKAGIDAQLARRYGITPAAMRPWHYQDRFFQEAPQVGVVNVDAHFRGKQVDQLARDFYAGIGLPVDDILKNSDIEGRRGKYQHAFETDIDRTGDIRVMLSVQDNQYWMGAMLHELGHGVFSKYISRDLPFFLRTESHAFVTEAIAELMERQADNADWLAETVGLRGAEKERMRAVSEENLRRKQLIFSRWTQVMVRFERALYKNPDQDLNTLWWDLVEQYQHVRRPEHRNAPDWAAKIHLAQVPVYYHNYQLGELAASQINHAIATNVLRATGIHPSYARHPEVGAFLKDRLFAPGDSLRWDELMRQATGEPLTAKYFALEFVGS